MSNAKNTQTEKAAATETPVKKDGPMVYCGPTVKNTVKQYTVYHDSKAVPDAVNRFLDAVPMARGLLVPLDKFKDTRVALATVSDPYQCNRITDALAAAGIKFYCKSKDVNRHNTFDQARIGTLGIKPQYVTEVFVDKENADMALHIIHTLS